MVLHWYFVRDALVLGFELEVLSEVDDLLLVNDLEQLLDVFVHGLSLEIDVEHEVAVDHLQDLVALGLLLAVEPDALDVQDVLYQTLLIMLTMMS